MTVLQDRCDQLAAAVDARDSEAVYNGIDALVVALQDADRDDIVAALARLAPVVEAVPLGVGSNLAYIIWQLLQPEIDETALHEPLTRRVIEALERAARFPALWQQLTGDEAPPRPDDGSDNPEIPAILDRFKAAAPQLGLAEREAYQLAEAWFVCGLWVRPMLMPREEAHAWLAKVAPSQR